MCLASWPIELATSTQAISANATESGSAGPANCTENRIEKAIAAPGAMCVIDWKRTCGSPIEPSRRWSKERDGPAPAATVDLLLFGLPRGVIFPRRRVVRPASAEHGCDDAY